MGELEVRDLHLRLQGAYVLQGVSLRVGEGTTTVVLGSNGAGKTTLMRGILGLLPAEAGSVILDGSDIGRAPAWDRVTAGLGYVPQGRRLFPSLSVEEHLVVAERHDRPARRWTRADLFRLFPNLERRRNHRGPLSGGEQQMLAIARALVSDPRFLILDEPTEGLSPAIVASLVETLGSLRAEGLGILLVEQDHRIAATLADRAYILQSGRMCFESARPTEEVLTREMARIVALGTSTAA